MDHHMNEARLVAKSCAQNDLTLTWLLRQASIDRKIFYHWMDDYRSPSPASQRKLQKAKEFLDYIGRFSWE